MSGAQNPPYQESPQRKTHHSERVVGWYYVDPNSMRMMEVQHPDTGQTFTGVFVSIIDPNTGVEQIWITNRYGWSRADGWMAAAYRERKGMEAPQ